MDAYLRVSRTMGRSGPGYISPSVQRESIERWAAYNGVTIDRWHEDYDESGGTQNRPGLRAALDRIELRETGGMVCWRVDRFARNVGPAEADIELIRQNDARIAFADENLDTEGPMGAFLMTTLLAMARLQRDRLSAGFSDARSRAIERGGWIGKAPLGYRKISDKNHPRAKGLEPDPETSWIVQEAFRLAAAGTVRDAQRYLQEHVPAMHWDQRGDVRRFLSKRSYLGESRHGEFVHATAHEPLVSVGTWLSAQHEPTFKREPSQKYPLSGIARCASCGGPLVGQLGHARIDGVRPRRYRCAYKWNQGENCTKPTSILAALLEDEVRSQLEDLLRGVTVSIGSGVDLAGLEDAIGEARTEEIEYVSDLDLRRAMSREAWAAGARARAEETRGAEESYRVAAANATRRELPLAAELSDPRQFARALSIVDHIDVNRGRGPAVGRIKIHLDDGAGVLDA